METPTLAAVRAEEDSPVESNPVHLRPNDIQFVEAVANTYKNEHWSREELRSVAADAMRLIYKIASQYTDQSCQELNQEELEAAGRDKLIHRLSKDLLRKTCGPKDIRRAGKPFNRAELFKHLKACLNNHLKGFVHRNRYTLKRTGRKVPPKRITVTDDELLDKLNLLWKDLSATDRDKVSIKHDNKVYFKDRNAVTGKFGEWYYLCEEDYDRSFKPEVSLSDPEVSAAVERAASTVDDVVLREYGDDMEEILTPLEFLVFKQLAQANSNALVHATLDMWRGPGTCSQLVVREEHLAAGLGMSVGVFHAVVEQLRPKVRHYMSDKGAELESGHHAAVAALEKVFGLQIHRSLDPLTLKRTLTVAARVSYEKVDENVASLLKAVGAQIPKVGGNGNLVCYGALHQKNNRICLQCGIQSACAVETANFGMDGIVLSPKLVGAKGLTRTPYVTDEVPPGTLPATTTVQSTPETPLDHAEDELKTYLHDHFKAARFDEELYFRHKERRKDGKMKYVFWLGRRAHDGKPDRLCVRFCKPSDQLVAFLEKDGAGYYPPEGMLIRQVIELINQHASETF